MPFAATWMEEIIILSEARQRETLHDIACMANLERNDRSLYKTETDSQLREQTYGHQGGRLGGRDS